MLQSFDLSAIKPFYPAVDETALPNAMLRLPAGRTLTTRQHKRSMLNLSRARKAAQQLERLPDEGETLHTVLDGTFALFDFIPAVIDLSGVPIDSLTIATLGFSKNNVESLAALIDAGQVKQLAVLCSHFFAAANIDGEIYSQMAALCARHSFPIAAMRTHAKLLLLATGQRRIVVESSANLRSCHNVETAVLFDDPKLYDFHRAWVLELLAKGAAI